MVKHILKVIVFLSVMLVIALCQIKYHYKYMADKQKIINDIYFDKSGFGSRKTTLGDSKKKINQLRWQMLKGFLKQM